VRHDLRTWKCSIFKKKIELKLSSCNVLRINEFRNLNYAEWHMKSKLEFWLTEFFFWSYSVVSIVIIKRKLNEHKMRENWTLSIMVAVVYLPGIAAPRSNLGDFLTIIFFEFNFKFSACYDDHRVADLFLRFDIMLRDQMVN